MAKRSNFPSRKDARREAAKVRAAARAERGDKGQLKKLLALGYTEWNSREVARLLARSLHS